ncbi:hypothetical protein WME91_18700 [Sorangium sp. So ce269]
MQIVQTLARSAPRPPTDRTPAPRNAGLAARHASCSSAFERLNVDDEPVDDGDDADR